MFLQLPEFNNEAILTTTATFDTEPKTTAAQRKWFKAHGPKNPILVAVEAARLSGGRLSAHTLTDCAYSGTGGNCLYMSKRNSGPRHRAQINASRS